MNKLYFEAMMAQVDLCNDIGSLEQMLFDLEHEKIVLPGLDGTEHGAQCFVLIRKLKRKLHVTDDWFNFYAALGVDEYMRPTPSQDRTFFDGPVDLDPKKAADWRPVPIPDRTFKLPDMGAKFEGHRLCLQELIDKTFENVDLDPKKDTKHTLEVVARAWAYWKVIEGEIAASRQLTNYMVQGFSSGLSFVASAADAEAKAPFLVTEYK